MTMINKKEPMSYGEFIHAYTGQESTQNAFCKYVVAKGLSRGLKSWSTWHDIYLSFLDYLDEIKGVQRVPGGVTINYTKGLIKIGNEPYRPYR